MEWKWVEFRVPDIRETLKRWLSPRQPRADMPLLDDIQKYIEKTVLPIAARHLS